MMTMATLSLPASMISTDVQRAAERTARAVREGLVESINGKDVRVGADTICVHSDTPNAAEVARVVRKIVAEFL